MRFHAVSGNADALRAVVAQKIEAAYETLEDSGKFREWLSKPPDGWRHGNSSSYPIHEQGPVVAFLRKLLPRFVQVSHFESGVQLQDWKTAGRPVLALDMPAWVRRFHECWWDISRRRSQAPELDDELAMPVESVLALLDKVGA